MSHGNDHTSQTSASNNDYVRALVNAGYRWDTSSETGNSREIRMTFAGSGFNAGQANAVGIVLGHWQAVADIQFVEVVGETDADLSPRESAELLFSLTQSTSIGGFGGYSGTPFQAFNDNTTVNENGDTILVADRGRTYTYIASDARLNGRDAFDGSGNFTNAGRTLMMHEIGHALGLKHPHDPGATNFPFYFPGVTAGDPSDLGDNSLNQNLYSIMSYNDATIGYDCATPMAFDIAAIQTLYGARTNASTGNDTYTIPDPGSLTTWRCIWDTGGIDEIVYNGTATVIILLQPATLDNSPAGGGPASYSYGSTAFGSGFTIAGDITNAIPDRNGVTGVIIENARGGSANDLLGGNDADNVLDGRGGGDDMRGYRGDDTYYVDNVDDRVFEELNGGANDYVNTTLTSYTLGANVEFLNFLGPSSTGFSGTGNALDNTILGYFGDDVLDGREGADSMFGYSGNDTYYVDNVRDVVSDSTGNDRVNTTLTSYTLGAGIEVLDYQGNSTANFRGTGNDSANTIQGFGGDDILDGKSGADLMRGYGGNDTFYVDDAGDVVEDFSGTNTVFTSVDYTLAAGRAVAVFATTNAAGTASIDLTGNERAQTLRANDGFNTLDGGGGADIMTGYDNNDTYFVDDAGDQVIEGAGGGTNDRIFTSVGYVLRAGQEVETIGIVGSAGTDTAIKLTGNEKVQRLDGSNGANTLDGKAGADTMAGYGGDDTYFVDNAGDKVLEAANAGTADRVFTTISYALAAGQEIETLGTSDLLGTRAINLTGNEKAQTLVGNNGANSLDGKAGADTMIGYAGNDIFYVDNAGDRVIEAVGGGTADRAIASTSYTLEAGQEVETLSTASSTATTAMSLTGNDKVQTLLGNAGINSLDGKAGADTMVGYGGNDTYTVDNAGDRVIEAANGGTADRVLASAGYTLAAGQEIETLATTNAGATTALSLTGNDKAQTLTGNNGANTLDGKAGADILRGNGGADTFAFTTALGSGNVDRIVDFSPAADTIQLSRSIFSALGTGALDADAFKKLGVAGASVDADDRILYNANTGALSYDVDGSGTTRAAVQFALLDNKAGLTFQDFLVV